MKRLLLTAALSTVAVFQTLESRAGQFITLKTINGRTWLVKPDGQPFFPHGITHTVQREKGIGSKAVSEACKALGFNAYGYGCDTALKDDMPYLQGWNDLVPISMYNSAKKFGYRDVFDPAVQKSIRNAIRKTCLENRDNPNLIGYMWTDMPNWPLKNRRKVNWVEFMKKLPADAPGKKAYETFLKENPGGTDLDFLRLIARKYFSIVGKATRKFDSHHLIFGDRFGFQLVVDEVLEEMVPYVDAISIQPNYIAGFPREKYERIHKLTGKPIVICDFAIRFKDGDKPIRGAKLEASDDIAGERYAEYIRDAFETPYIIGSFWCNLLDFSPPGKTGIKQGIFNDGLTPRPALHRHIKALNRYLEENTPQR